LKRAVNAVFLAEQFGDLTPGFAGSSPAPDLFQVRPKRRLVSDGSGFFHEARETARIYAEFKIFLAFQVDSNTFRLKTF
jgi:hypothetical protein